jgi:O-antigen/teichoic acid export membrane protein
MRANNRQGPAVVCAIFCAILNVALDWLLIPGHGAAGAAIGNGVAQSALVISYWIMSIMMFGIPLDFRAVAKVTLASLAMAPVVMLGNHLLPALPGLIAGVVSGALTFIAVLAATSFFQSEDYARLGHLGRVLPRVCQPAFSTVLSFLVPASAAGTDADS